MSDSNPSYGEPVDDPKPVDDVVESSNESLADAEAAGRDAVTDAEPAASEPEPEPAAEPERAAEPEPAASVPAPEPEEDEITDASAYLAAYDAASADDEDEPHADTAHESAVATHAYEAPAVAAGAAAVVAPSEPVAEAVAPVYAPQPIFVQAPEPPRSRGNRAAAGAIGILAALSFAILYLGLWLAVGLLTGDMTTDGVVDAITAALMSWIFWTPVVFFFIGFWLLGAIINRGRWAHWVIWGVFVGFVSWAGFIAGEYFQAPFWMLTPTEGVQLLADNVFSPLAVVAFIVGRELTIWFGAWAAARGARVSELNAEAMREYERTLEAGPQLYQQ